MTTAVLRTAGDGVQKRKCILAQNKLFLFLPEVEFSEERESFVLMRPGRICAEKDILRWVSRKNVSDGRGFVQKVEGV